MQNGTTSKNNLCSKFKAMAWTKVKGFSNIMYLIQGMCCLLVFPPLVFNQGKLRSLLSENSNFGLP